MSDIKHPASGPTTNGAQNTGVHGRTTANQKTGEKFRDVAQGVGRGVGAVANLAAPALPGAGIVSTGINLAGGAMSGGGAMTNMAGGGFGGNSIGLASTAGMGGAGLGTVGFGGAGMGVGGMGTMNPGMGGNNLLTSMASQGQYYLAMQMELQMENRQFSSLSNALKVRHDTAKAAIQNFRA